jgi:hypothetical protein
VAMRVRLIKQAPAHSGASQGARRALIAVAPRPRGSQIKLARPQPPARALSRHGRPRRSNRSSGGLRAHFVSMTAMSAQRASETPSTANSLRDLVASLRTVVVPGSPATYANRAALRAIGLRWDPAGHCWHGTTTMDRVRELRERLGLELRCFGELDVAPIIRAAPKPALPTRPAQGPGPITMPTREPVYCPHDGSWTRLEGRVALPLLEEPEGIPTPTRWFTVREITSGLPDDSRREDERQEERRLRDLRGRVKRARAVVATTPGLAETLAGDWRKAARFYARNGITEEMLRRGVPLGLPGEGDVSARSTSTKAGPKHFALQVLRPL